MPSQKIDLDKMSLEDLKAHSKDVDKAIASFEKRKRVEAMAEIQAVARKHGLSVDDILGGKRKGKTKSPAKYRNPENAEDVWSGRGRQPAWFKAALAAGNKPESLEI